MATRQVIRRTVSTLPPSLTDGIPPSRVAELEARYGEDPVGTEAMLRKHRQQMRMKRAGLKTASVPDPLLIAYVPPYQEGKRAGPLKLRRAISAAFEPRHEPVSSWRIGRRMRESLGQYMGEQINQRSMVDQLFPNKAREKGGWRDRMTEPSTDVAPFLASADSTWRFMHRSFAQGTLDSAEAKQLIHPDLLSTLTQKRARLLSSFPPSTTLSWSSYPESASSGEDRPAGEIVAATRREVDLDRPVGQVVVRFRSWQKLEARVGDEVVKGGTDDDLKLIMEYWAFQKQDWTSPDPVSGWQIFRQVYEDPKPDWLVA